MNGTLRGLVLSGIVLCSGGTARSAGVEADLAPRKARWHFLPARIAGAFVGRGGKCFYLARGKPAKTPFVSKAGVLAPGFRPLLLDQSGRLWCIRPDASLIYGIRGRSVVELRPAKEAFFGTVEQVDGKTEVRTSAYEDAAGRVWFGNSRGVQWHDGKRWFAKDLADRSGLEVALPMSSLHVAEDDQGRLYFWARRPERGACGTRGFWTFDGKGWDHFTVQDGLPDDRVEAVCPTGGGAVLVNTAGGRLARFSTKRRDLGREVTRLVGLLNSPKWKVRETATHALRRLGRGARLELKKHLARTKQPEVRARIKMVLTALTTPGAREQRLLDSDYICGQVRIRPPRLRRRPRAALEWLALAQKVVNTRTGEKLDRAAFVLGAGSVRRIKDWPASDGPERASLLFDGRGGAWIGLPGRGLFHWDGRQTAAVSDGATRDYHRILGRDRLGRILLSNGTGVAAYWPAQPDTRKKLVGRTWRIGQYGVWAMDTRGRVWTKVAGRKEPLSYYEGGAWHGVRDVAGAEPGILIPGRSGAIFVSMVGADGGFYLLADGKTYKATDLGALARNHPDLVKKYVDNSQAARSPYYALALDALGRVWSLSPKNLLLWSGKRQTDIGAALVGGTAFPRAAVFNIYDGGRTLIFGRLPGRAAHIDCGRSKPTAAPCPKRCRGFTLFDRHLVDRAGRFWHGSSSGKACIHTGKRVEEAPARGVVALCDSSGAVWLCEPGVGCNVVGAGAGRRITLRLASVRADTPVCEGRPGEVWVACADGLRKYVRKAQTIVPAGVYRRGFPLSRPAGLAADSSGVLWLLNGRRDGYKLTRVEASRDDTESR